MNLQDLPVVDVVMGIDIGTYRTGLAAIEVGKRGCLVAHARIVAPGEEDYDNYVERWEMIVDQVQAFMEHTLKGRPVAVAVEQPNSFRNARTTRMLTGGFGVVMYWLHTNKLLGIEINTAHAKAIFCGRGGGGKEPTLDRANELYGLHLVYKKDPKKSDDDVSDAIQVAFTARYHLVEEDPWFSERAQRD